MKLEGEKKFQVRIDISLSRQGELVLTNMGRRKILLAAGIDTEIELMIHEGKPALQSICSGVSMAQSNELPVQLLAPIELAVQALLETMVDYREGKKKPDRQEIRDIETGELVGGSKPH